MRMLRLIAQNLAQPAIVFYTMPVLMAILIAGTLAQGGIGIYEAQRQYFASFILWAGPVPLPGGFTVLGFLALNLLLKFLFYSEWRWGRAGIILAHLGALTLLIGGLLTALFAREGYMALTEGQTSPYVYDYNARELSVFRDDNSVYKVPFGDLKAGAALAIPGLPFTLTALSVCENCDITRRAETAQDFLTGEPRDLAAKMALSPKTPDKDLEKNLSGLTFSITGADTAQDGSYIAFEAMPRPVSVKAGGKTYAIILGKAQRTLPFALELKDFKKEDHPGTQRAKAYSSAVTVHDGTLGWDALISMNAPLRHRGYTFYQSSFEQGGEKEVSILSVVENKGRLVPYIGTIIIAAGLLLHLALTLRKSGKTALLLLALLLPLSPAQAAGDSPLPLNAFRALPVQHDGRIKPLESFARITLLHLSGEETLQGKPAIRWLAGTLFDPANAAQEPLFRLASPALIKMLGLSESEKGPLSYAALAPAILRTEEEARRLVTLPPENLTPEQKDLLDLHQNFGLYGQLLRGLTPVLPLDVEPPAAFKELGEKRYTLSYLDFSRLRPEIDALVKDILRRKGQALKTYTEEELRTVQLSFALDQIRAGAEPNTAFAVLPPLWDKDTNPAWQTPWQMLLSGGGSPESAALLKDWQALGLAWQESDPAKWQDTVSALQTETEKAAGPSLRPQAVSAEVLYQTLKPMRWAMALYGLAIVLFISTSFSPHRLRLWFLQKPSLVFFSPWGGGQGGGATMLGLAIALHAAFIAARIYILERPPVGTLYESVLFVALVAALAGFGAGLALRSRLLAGTGALAGLLLLAVAPVTAPDAASLDVLSAVLNTNFWLGTHVLVITSGYGFCILTALLAHIALWAPGSRLAGLPYKTSLAALLLTCVGTILGGIWADQSWGRFWGWDPKENGALLIVLWLIWVQHGRLSKHLNEAAFLAGLAFLNVVVALSWFGVNLLGVGLHSYGFTSGLAAGLFAFCAAETLIIGFLWIRRAKLC
jgi:ABC-type transport system involved in cytochrome c biogenesis permease subunit